MTALDACPKCGEQPFDVDSPTYWDEQYVIIPKTCPSEECGYEWTETYDHVASEFNNDDSRETIYA